MVTQNNQPTIVCIDDDPNMLELLELILKRENFSVISVQEGREGLETIRRAQPDLVLLDLMMPGIDGWELYRQIKNTSALAHIPIIIVTARAARIDKMLGRIAKVDAYVTKPFRRAELLSTARRLLEQDL